MSYIVDVTSSTQSYNVSVNVETDKYIVDVKVGDSVESKFWAEQAQYYADQALVSSLEAGSFASNALNSANAAAASELSASQSATTATTKANEASASASDALASQNSASASASTATTQAGIATTQAGIATTQAGIATTQANNAAASASAASASAATITNQVSFAGAQNGDLLLRQAGIFSRINQTEFLRSKVPFEKSPLSGLLDLDKVFAWDSFNRPDSSSIGMADSGQTWLSLGSIETFNIASNRAVRTATTNILTVSVIERTDFGSTDLFGNGGSCELFCNLFDSGIGTIGVGLIFAKDSNNYFYVTANGSSVTLSKVIAGVLTVVGSVSKLNSSSRNYGYLNVLFNRRNFDSVIEIFIDSNMIAQKSVFNLNSDYSVFGTNQNDIRYVGVITGTGTSRRSINNFIAKNSSL